MFSWRYNILISLDIWIHEDYICVILILKAPQNHRSINPKNDPKSKTWEVKVQFSKMFERMIYAVACMLYQEWRLQRDASSMFKCGEFPNAPSWEFLAYIVTAVCRCDDMCFYHFCCRTILWRLFIGQDFCTSEGHHISWAKGLRVRATYTD